MKTYNRWNLILGWFIFLVAAITYLLTLEPTVSWWDCGEFIASSYKLQVGHPPGAPLFLMMGRVFSLFASDPEHVAVMINAMSGLASAFTILFLFWTISHLVRKMVITAEEKYTKLNLILIFGSAAVGALAYTFSDSFWFSAVEAEVYGTSSLFTAIVFWAILKWENISHEKHADRWLILIAYLMGLSIGVHLLNLLAIPAIVLVYYFNRYKVTRTGFFKAILVSILILGVIMYGIINGLIFMASKFELAFVNSFGLPYNSGVIFYTLLIAGLLIWGITYTHHRGKVAWNTILTGITVIIIGYSSYALIVIRSASNPPMDENDPSNVFALYSYLNREQYGERPLIFGHYYSDDIRRDASGYPVLKEGKATWVKDTVRGNYRVADRNLDVVYTENAKLFPRMYSRESDHIKAYKQWGAQGNKEKPGFFNNVIFFVNYQLGNMYLRYFMWNFAGRQNDVQYDGSNVHGNWISGISFLDSIRLGNQELLPDSYRNSKSRNKYYLLPLILGLLGLLFQVSRDMKNFSVVLFLFFFTGIAIVIYLNQTPLQPRERDYAYSGSFYAFAIWIGIGVAAIYDALQNYRKGVVTASFIVLIALLAVPGVMARENWDDHDRSGRYIARDIAKDYLASCAQNAILFTNGDNDTFPLWYVQEVEGFRTDVRVVNLMLFNLEWNIRQMRMKNYESEPLPFTLPEKDYAEGVNNSFYVLKDARKLRMSTLVQGVKTGNSQFHQRTVRGEDITVIPANNLVLPVDSLTILANGTVKEADMHELENPMEWTIPQGQYLKGNLAQLDILASFNWERPIYFVTGGNQGALSLEDFFQLEGLAFRVVPINTPGRDFFNFGRIDTSILYTNLMKKFTWGNMNHPGVNIDYYTQRTFSVIRFRKNFVRLAETFIKAGNKKKAEEILDRCMELAPNEVLPYDYYVSGISYPGKDSQIIHQSGIIETYYECGATEKANRLLLEYAGWLRQDLIYYDALSQRFKSRFSEEFYKSQGIYEELVRLAKDYGQEDVVSRL